MLTAQKILPITKGILKKILISRKHDARTGGTDDARYCYAVWMRHLHYASRFGFDPQEKTVAELGPGDSIGIGLAALLSGCDRYIALDMVKYWDTERNLRMFDQLVDLFRNRSSVPDASDFPRVNPTMDNYLFPHGIFSEKRMRNNLADERISRIRKEILHLEKGKSDKLQSFVPWTTTASIPMESIDHLFSQAVLAYVEDLDMLYKKMNHWLKNKGTMSHTIDFSSHGITREWNGQWTFSKHEWELAHGNSQLVLNRAPRSTHHALNYSYGFEILMTRDVKRESKYLPDELHEAFKHLSVEDTRTFASFILSRKIRKV